MKLSHGLIWIATVLVVFWLHIPAANAHPLGNFTINHYAGLHIVPTQIEVDYVLDMAEIPAFQEINQFDLMSHSTAGSATTTDYAANKCRQLQSQLTVQGDRQPLKLALNRATVEFPPGVGGLATLRLTCDFEAAIAPHTIQQLTFADAAYAQRLGWREITVTADHVPIRGDFSPTSVSNRLTEYPTDLLNSPLNQRQVLVEFDPVVATQSSTASASSITVTRSSNPAMTGRQNDAFTNLVTLKKLNLPTLSMALAIAFVWGGIHALSPGHGKTIVSAYLIGSRSTVQHALWLGLTVTLTHTAGIFALGLLMLSTSRFVLTEQIFPWLSMLSGVLVTAIGGRLLLSRLRQLQFFQNWRLKHHHFTDLRSHTHNHHLNHSHPHAPHSDHDHPDHHSHLHTHNHLHTHSHGTHAHSHLPPGADDTPVNWSSILALGISGGILPCPSALVVLLSAIAVGRVGLGLTLVTAFSLGLASVLTAIGLTLVYTKHLFERLPLQFTQSRLFPAASALVITLMGMGITAQAVFTSMP
jgi:ABC-type nickel/cobalt efflux system permease component RcnA